ncbi:MAG: hypothetical protein N2578_04195 [Bdellovibrionaceae bacterium]|nr:hypothetical protein [Pseudobdellovibrionaceae bacterium]
MAKTTAESSFKACQEAGGNTTQECQQKASIEAKGTYRSCSKKIVEYREATLKEYQQKLKELKAHYEAKLSNPPDFHSVEPVKTASAKPTKKKKKLNVEMSQTDEDEASVLDTSELDRNGTPVESEPAEDIY